MIESKELDKLNKKLEKISERLYKAVDEMPESVTKELGWGAIKIRNTIIESMQQEKKTGNIYRKGKKSSKRFHQASAPGEAPAVDTGAGLRSVMFDIRKQKMEVEIGTVGATYLAMLEGGTVKIFGEGTILGDIIEPRPWLGPAVEKHYEEIIHDVGEEVFKVTKKPFEGK